MRTEAERKRPGSGEEAGSALSVWRQPGRKGVKIPEVGMGRGVGVGWWGGQRGPPLTEFLWQEIANMFILRQGLDVEFEPGGVAEGRCVPCRVKAADGRGRHALRSGSWSDGGNATPRSLEKRGNWVLGVTGRRQALLEG